MHPYTASQPFRRGFDGWEYDFPTQTPLSEHNKPLMAPVEEMRELSAIRDRFAASEIWSTEAQDRHLAELRDIQARLEGDASRAQEELIAYQNRAWWRGLVG